jgi:hypothetical protein
MTVRSNDLAREICAALGIPVTMVRSIRIDMQAFEPARITIERLFQDNETNAITEVLERYTLQDVRTQVGEAQGQAATAGAAVPDVPADRTSHGSNGR